MNKEQISVEDLQARISNFMEKAGSVRDEVAFGFEVSEGLSKELLLPSVQGDEPLPHYPGSSKQRLEVCRSLSNKSKIVLENNTAWPPLQTMGKALILLALNKEMAWTNMKKRACDLSGDATITSEKEKGTQVTVRFPWHESVLWMQVDRRK